MRLRIMPCHREYSEIECGKALRFDIGRLAIAVGWMPGSPTLTRFGKQESQRGYIARIGPLAVGFAVKPKEGK